MGDAERRRIISEVGAPDQLSNFPYVVEGSDDDTTRKTEDLRMKLDALEQRTSQNQQVQDKK